MHILQQVKKFQEEKIEYYYALSLILVYGVWKVVKTYIGPNIERLDSFGVAFNEGFAEVYVKLTALLLNLLSISYTTFETVTSYGTFITIAINGAAGIYVAYHCLGVSAILVYSISLLLLPGTINRKLFFAIVGVGTMVLMNSARITSLVFLDKYTSRFWVDLNHSLIFVVMFYSLLLMFHYIYLRPYLSAARKN
jgi:exosortase/archaeosortase family protein